MTVARKAADIYALDASLKSTYRGCGIIVPPAPMFFKNLISSDHFGTYLNF